MLDKIDGSISFLEAARDADDDSATLIVYTTLHVAWLQAHPDFCGKLRGFKVGDRPPEKLGSLWIPGQASAYMSQQCPRSSPVMVRSSGKSVAVFRRFEHLRNRACLAMRLRPSSHTS